MSYYMLAARFWMEVGAVMGALPVVALSVSGLMHAFGRSVPTVFDHTPHSTQTGPASC